MNKTHRLIWSEIRQDWVVTSELASARGKPSRVKPAVALLASALASFGSNAQVPAPNALPTSGQVVAGQAAISQAGSTMNIQQSSQQAIVNWQSFNIGANATVNFQQPNASAVALNRVLGTDPSAIYGNLNANGQVFLLNPSGVVFGPGARVDVGGLVASTLNIRNEDFLSGHLRFARDGAAGSVINEGDLFGRYVALLAPEVRNEGVIIARQGAAALAAGDAVTLSIAGSSLVGVQVDKASINTLVENRRLIQADQGLVILSAQSAHALVGRVVNTGTVQAGGISTDGGVVRLVASSAIEHSGSISSDAGTNGRGGDVTLISDLSSPASRTVVSGSISAKGGSVSGDGGFIETSASRLAITDSARIDTSAANGQTGQWLLDPYDFTVAASGGDMTGATLSTALATNNVTIETTDSAASCAPATCTTGSASGNGDIHINDTVTWTSDKTLTLSAWRDVNINGTLNINADNSGAGGGLEVRYGLKDAAVIGVNDSWFTVTGKVNLGANATLRTRFGNDGFDEDYTIIRTVGELDNLRTQTDVDFNGIGGSYALGADLVIASGNWTPLGDGVPGGNFNFPSSFEGTFEGLGHTISGIVIPNTANAMNVGLFGLLQSSAVVRNVGVINANVAGRANVGALAGQNVGGIIHNAWSSGTVTGSDVGGVGTNTGTTDDAVGAIGGLVGYNFGLMNRSRSEATVTALSGDQSGGGGVGGGVGGLVGAQSVMPILNSYATGDVKGLNEVGGLAGFVAGNIVQSYSRGKVNEGVSGATAATVGGLLGTVLPGIEVKGSFWDTEASLQAARTSPGFPEGVGLTTAQMQDSANFTSATAANGSVDPKWNQSEGMPDDYTPRVVWKFTAGEHPRFIDSTDFATGTPAPGTITISLDSISQVYGTTTAASSLTGFGVTGLVTGDTISGADWGSFYSATLPVGGYAYASTNNLISLETGFNSTNSHTLSQYTLNWSSPTNGLTVTPKTVALSASKTYDGGTSIAANQLTVATGVGTETLGFTLGGTLTSSSKNVFDADKYITNPGVITLTADGANPGDPGNYALPTATHSAANTVTITKKTLAITAPDTSQMPSLPLGNIFDQSVRSGVVKKYYDGTDTTPYAITINQTIGTSGSTGAGTTGDGLKYSGDDVSVSSSTATATFSGGTVAADAGSGKTVTLNAALTGSEAGNYQLGLTLPGEIVKRPVKLEATKVYDGNTDLTGLVTVTTGVPGQQLTLTGSPVAHSKNVDEFGLSNYVNGTGLGLAAVSGTGANADNYQLPSLVSFHPGFNTAIITPKTVTLAATKTYDGTIAIAANQLTVTGVGAETLNFSIGGAGTLTANSKDVSANGSNYISAGTLTLADGSNGELARNYQLPSFGSYSADNTVTLGAKTLLIDFPLPSSAPGALSISAPTGTIAKYYDGSNALPSIPTTGPGAPALLDDQTAGLGTAVDGKPYTGDGVTLQGSLSGATFSGTNAGDWTVSLAGFSLGNNASGNYQIAATAPGKIAPRPVTLTATKPFDGSATLNAGHITVVTGITETLGFTLNGTPTASSSAVDGTQKFITNPGTITLTSGGANPGNPANYTLPAGAFSAQNTVTITPAGGVSYIAFTRIPTVETSGVVFTTQPVVKAFNTSAGVETSYISPVTLTVTREDGTTTGISLQPTNLTTANMVAGQANFVGLKVTAPAGRYVLSVTSGGYTATSKFSIFSDATSATTAKAVEQSQSVQVKLKLEFDSAIPDNSIAKSTLENALKQESCTALGLVGASCARVTVTLSKS